jgi:hypothetical protein
MANNHEAREPTTKLAVWAQSKLGTVWFYVGPGRSGTNKRTGLGQETRHDPFTSKPVKPVFLTKTCLPARIACFSARFFVLNGPTRPV